MADRHPKSRAFLSNGPDRANVAKIQARINALCIHIERYSNYIHVACTLAVAKRCPSSASPTGQKPNSDPADAISATLFLVQAAAAYLALAKEPADPLDP